MTTSWAFVSRGRLLAAFQANVGGALLAMFAAVLAPCLLLAGIRGRRLFRPISEWTAAVVCVVVMLVTLVDWGFRLLASWR